MCLTNGCALFFATFAVLLVEVKLLCVAEDSGFMGLVVLIATRVAG